MADKPAPLMDVREDDQFLTDKRDVEAALVHARRFGTDKPIKNHQEAGDVTDAIKALKIVIGEAEEHRLGITAPYRATTDAVNGQYSELLSLPKSAIKGLEAKALAFKRAEDKRIAEERRREQERLDAEAEKKAEEAQKAAERANEEPESPASQRAAAEAHQAAAAAAVAKPAPRKDPKQLRGSFAALGSQVHYRWEVVDLTALPDPHKTFNKKTIDAAVKGEKAMAKAEERDFNLQLIPGVRIWTEESGVSR